MDYLYKQFAGESIQRRQIIDHHLSQLPCTDLVSVYLLQQRELNRQLTAEYINAGFFETLELGKKHLDIQNNIQNALLYALPRERTDEEVPKDSCEILRRLLNQKRI